MAKPLPRVIQVVCLPDGHSMQSLAETTLPGSEYAKLACTAQRIPTQCVYMDRAVELYASSMGYDIDHVRQVYIEAQISVLNEGLDVGRASIPH